MTAAKQKEMVDAGVRYLETQLESVPKTAVILGTGLGSVGDRMKIVCSIPYEDIPAFPVSTVESHQGRLLLGRLDDTSVLALQGRFHLYEGYTARELTLPIRVMAQLGIRNMILSNAAGGLNPLFRKGDVMMITDHINLQGINPLEGPNVDEWGPRFLDMSEPYDVELRKLAEESALEHGIRLTQGVYVAVPGPNLETRAEYRFLRTIGADAVGMSTVPEVLVARHMSVRVLAFSVITDECFPDALEPVSIEDVLAAGRHAEPWLYTLLSTVASAIEST